MALPEAVVGSADLFVRDVVTTLTNSQEIYMATTTTDGQGLWRLRGIQQTPKQIGR